MQKLLMMSMLLVSISATNPVLALVLLQRDCSTARPVTTIWNSNLTANPLMDSLTYFYTGGTNRLDHIRDRNAGSTAHSNNYAPAVDIKDQAAGNYSYDAIGNLKSSEWMGDDDISWNVYGKVVEVEKRALAGVTSRFLHYYYDPSGNKAGETVRHGSGGTAYYNHRWYVRDAQGNVLATYEVNNAASASAGTLKLREHHLYGSRRLGIINRDQDVDADKLTAVDETNLGDTYLLNFTRGNKLFELTNHLGNVLTVLSDKKAGRPKSGDPSMIGIYDFDMVTAADYTPFGMVMLGRNFSFLSRYRYGFNGKEYDNEFKGAGNALDYGFRMYDPLVGRFLSVDPLTSKYPWYTPYQFAGNKPIWAVDLDGLEEKPTNNGSREGEMQPRSGDVQSTKGPFKEIVKKDWFWHSGSKEYGTKADWYEEKDYKNVIWPIATDLAGYADMYRSSGIGKNWSDDEKANVANTKLGQFLSSGLSEKEVKGLLSQAYNVSMTQATNSSGRVEFSPINVESIIGLGQLVKGLMSNVAAKGGENLAFGLGKNLDEFSAAVGFKNYRQFTSGGFKPNEIEGAIKNTTNNLHFNLTDFTRWKYLKYSNNPVSPTLGNITNWELHTIYNTPGALQRTTFYKFINGSYQVVPKPF
ncbi:MAG TPA: RHS repeat-associated core domain-containing protein [Flavipsychrobacter sp.]|uniref:RHS repeat domain-containing protein n=1 Tax=Agriterribacter sp. TaxID=2821509 RepID=UPI002CA55F07|nr:RHS repeat-associated core domain-containing protein [Agriterribacter sp.]HTN08242.1 RHS repeat-associated core domain-containing protein [Agriterribacter sp.]HTN46608.1 RHS repeat-associated core domain-containing protein [Flavipsychrobacter sp.]